MTVTFDQFKDTAADILSINLSGYKIKRVQRRTDSLMRRHNIPDYESCLQLLETDSDFREAYLNHFTINTSEFFRNPENFDYLQEKILPELFQKNKLVKIWSAPCSNGSEPYTVAIILKELKYRKERFQLLASDLDPQIISTARRGIYGSNSLQKVPPHLIDRYFMTGQEGNRKYQLSEEITDLVKLEIKDLIEEDYEYGWDCILSRNFFIYLTRELKEQLTRKFTAALNPGGYLFLGNTEFIFNPEKYGLKKVFSSFYQKTDRMKSTIPLFHSS